MDLTKGAFFVTEYEEIRVTPGGRPPRGTADKEAFGRGRMHPPRRWGRPRCRRARWRRPDPRKRRGAILLSPLDGPDSVRIPAPGSPLSQRPRCMGMIT